MIITFGKKGERFDLTAWDAHCQRYLGRTVKLYTKLSAHDLSALGYGAAASALSYHGGLGAWNQRFCENRNGY